MATQFDLTSAHLGAVDAARHWGLELGPPFALSTVSYVAPAGEFVVKVAWQGDDESLHEPEALALRDGDGAVRLRGRHGRAVLEERAVPGDDLAAVPEPDADAVAAATATASKLWRRAQPPFRPVVPEVRRWLDNSGSELVPLAREMLAQIGDTDQWLVHGTLWGALTRRTAVFRSALEPIEAFAGERERTSPLLLMCLPSHARAIRARCYRAGADDGSVVGRRRCSNSARAGELEADWRLSG